MTSKGEWVVVGDTLDTDGLNNKDYKRKYQRLQAGRRKWLEENQRPRKGDTADTEQTIQTLMRTLQEKENEKVRDAQRFRQQLEQKEREEAEKEEEIQRYHHLLQEKEREEAEKEQQYRHQLQENIRELQEKNRELQENKGELQAKERELQGKNRELQRKNRELQEKERELQGKNRELQEREGELQEKNRELQDKNRELQEKEGELQEKNRELQEKERELHQSQDAVRVYQQQQVSTDDHWVINKDEVILTREELGRGSYATVKVGTFRGLRVAVKSLHNIIISDYNRALFSREMSIASRVRHPNLVQFIGATKVGNPFILTELMNISLHAEIQKNQLTKQQILSIAQDVALGLNYLHLFKPQPIIHRDVSSPNVLLKPSIGPAGYEAKVADYGTANFQEKTCTVMPGNPAYAAPEARDPEQHSPAMDVYSYSVLLMEITLHQPPDMKLEAREQQSHNVSWSPMKSLIQRGLDTTRQRRPTMSQVIEALREIKV